MMRILRMAIPVLAAGALLAVAVGAQGGGDAQAAPADLLPADELTPERLDGLIREQLVALYVALEGDQTPPPPACLARRCSPTCRPSSMKGTAIGRCSPRPSGRDSAERVSGIPGAVQGADWIGGGKHETPY